MKKALLTITVFFCVVTGSPAADWPQFMLNSEHNGNAEHEELKLPLGLVAQVKLDDAVMTAPAVVRGLAYVVDQMGTAYCVDPKKGEILWKASPDGEKAMGSNTSSPCVVKGRVYYGTTAGTFHILNAEDGRVIKTIDIGWPILCSVTHANDSVYFQTVGAIVHCFDLDGKERWKWDHYKEFPPPKRGGKCGTHRPHYGGPAEVAVSGKNVVTTFGVDHFCLEDKGAKAELAWVDRKRDKAAHTGPMSSAISGGYVYTMCPGSDGRSSGLRLPLKSSFNRATGTFTQKEGVGRFGHRKAWNSYGVPVVRGNQVFYGTHSGAISRCVFDESGKSTHRGFTAATFGSPVLTKKHCVVTTILGELIAFKLDSWGRKAFTFKTPNGKGVGSSPAVCDGMVFFGCDDGFLYVLGPDGKLEPRKEDITLYEARSKVQPATKKKYAWPTSYGNQGNTKFVDDPDMKPPFRLRWAIRSFAVFKQPLSATEEDVIYACMAGTVACYEQSTGRMRWRKRLPKTHGFSVAGVLCVEDLIFVPNRSGFGGSGDCVKNLRYQLKKRKKLSEGTLYCLDRRAGRIVWSTGIGNGEWCHAPVHADGIVAYGSVRYRKEQDSFESVVEGWDAKTGKLAWQVKLNLDESKKGFVQADGCAENGVMFFTAGRSDNCETVAIEAKTGKVVWRTKEIYSRQLPAVLDGKLYFVGGTPPLACLSATDGSVIWKDEKGAQCYVGPTLGPAYDFFIVRGRGGKAKRFDLKDGKNGKYLGTDGWTCGPVLLTSGGLCLSMVVGGIHVRDAKEWKVLWKSKGFAIRACPAPAVANGRIFYAPQVNGMLYCFEPVGGSVEKER